MIFSFFDIVTGYFVDRKFTGLAHWVAGNTPVGTTAIEGDFDPLSQRFDLVTQAVVDYVPPAPAANYEWSASSKRWVKDAATQQAETDIEESTQEIARWEARALRSQREYMLGDAAALAYLQAAQVSIEAARSKLQAARAVLAG